MPSLSYLGALCSGHDGFGPRASIAGSSNVKVNGIGVLRVGDAFAPHCKKSSCHPGTVSAGSGTVKVNGQPAARIADMLDCGSAVAQGSPNVVAG